MQSSRTWSPWPMFLQTKIPCQQSFSGKNTHQTHGGCGFGLYSTKEIKIHPDIFIIDGMPEVFLAKFLSVAIERYLSKCCLKIFNLRRRKSKFLSSCPPKNLPSSDDPVIIHESMFKLKSFDLRVAGHYKIL